MTIEIVDLPLKMVIFHSFMYVYQAGYARSVSSISDIQIPRGFLKFPSKCPGYIFGQGIIVGYGGAFKNEGNAQQKPGSSSSGSQFSLFFLWEYHVSGQIHACHGQKSDYIIYNYI